MTCLLISNPSELSSSIAKKNGNLNSPAPILIQIILLLFTIFMVFIVYLFQFRNLTFNVTSITILFFSIAIFSMSSGGAFIFIATCISVIFHDLEYLKQRYKK